MVMKSIADGGAITKNVGTNTRDSLILAPRVLQLSNKKSLFFSENKLFLMFKM